MPRIKKIQENETTVYPVTIPEAIVLPDTQERLSDILSRIDSAINDKVDSSAIVDNLDTADATSPLSAKQGRVLASIKQDSLASGDGISIVNDVISVRFNKSDDDIAGPDSNGAYTLKNRTYNSLNPNGLGYVILKKKFSFASQVSQENTIYEIRSNFDLGGETVTIPSGCVLKFVGGKVLDGALIGNGGIVEASPVHIFDNVILKGFNLEYIDIRWFGAKEGEDIADVMEKVMLTYNQNIGTPIKIIGSYRLSRTVVCNSGIVIWNDYMVPDIREDKLHVGHNYKPLGRLDVAAGIIAFDCSWAAGAATSYAPIGTTSLRGLQCVADAQFDDDDNPTILIRHRISGQPPAGFKIEDCIFEGFDKTIYCDRNAGPYGSVMSQFLIDNCRFISNNGYALWVDNSNQSAGDLTINGLDMVRCSLSSTKLHLVGLYGVNRITELVINGSRSFPLSDPVYIRMKYGTLLLDQWYEEWLSGDFTIIGESGFNGSQSSNYYDHQSIVEIRDWYTMYNSYDIDTGAHPYLRLQNVSVKSLPDLLPKGNIMLDCVSIDKSALEIRTYDALRLNSIERISDPVSGISYGCIVVKTDDYSIVSRDAVSSVYINGVTTCEKMFRGYFDCSGGSVFKKAVKDNLFWRNWDMSSASSEKTKIFTLTNLTGQDVFSNSYGAILTFVKETNALNVNLVDSDDNTILTVRTPVSPGICMILLQGPLSQIASLKVSRALPIRTSLVCSPIGVRCSYESQESPSPGRFTVANTSIIQNCVVLNPSLPLSVGESTERPSNRIVLPGYQFFDTTLSKPIYFTGSGWVDSSGTQV